MKAQGGTGGERRQEGTSSLSDRGGGVNGGDPGRTEEMKTQSDTDGLEGQSGAAGSCDQVRDMELADRDRVGVTKGNGGTRGKEEPS